MLIIKAIAAYALVTCGIAHLAGMVFGTIVNFPVSLIIGLTRPKESLLEATAAIKSEPMAWLTRGKINMSMRDRIAHGCFDILCGIGAVLTAALIFYLLHVPLTIWVLLILFAWEIILMIYCNQSFRALFCTLAGLVTGWIIISQFHS